MPEGDDNAARVARHVKFAFLALRERYRTISPGIRLCQIVRCEEILNGSGRHAVAAEGNSNDFVASCGWTIPRSMKSYKQTTYDIIRK